MSPLSLQHRLLFEGCLDAADARALLDTARALRRPAAALSRPLRGRNIALICPREGSAEALAFDAAASALGARVARLSPEPAWLAGAAPIGDDLVRAIESLYDAVDCEDAPAGFARSLQVRLSVPVYDRLAHAGHPAQALLAELAGPAGSAIDDADRVRLMQAVLLRTLS